jgi:predicted acylesterase/phospholipase RssA
MFYNLVLSGGSIKGFSFIGCIKYLEEKKLSAHFNTVVGSSAGSIVAFMFCCGMTSCEMISFMKEEVKMYEKYEIDVDHMLDIFNKLGLDSGDYAIGLFKRILQKREKFRDYNDITFIEFAKSTGKNLVICGSNLSKSMSSYFNIDTDPDMSILKALRISISLPIVFPPVLYNDNIYADASLFNNFPIDYFSNKNIHHDTLGIIISNARTQVPFHKLNLMSYFGLLLGSSYCKINEKQTDVLKNNRIIPICFDGENPYNFDMNTLKFKMTNEMLSSYIKRGYDQINDAFEHVFPQNL